MGINRIKLANGITNPNQGLADPNLTARQVADQNPELHAMRQNFFGTGYLDDIDRGNTGTVQYYSGLGNPNNLQFTQPVVETPTVDTSTPVVDGGGGGGATLPGFTDTTPEPGNTAEQQRLIDEGIGLQIEPGSPVFAPGEEPVTQGDIDAFNQIPVNREYGDEMNIGYGEGQVDPSLAAAVGGVDTTPIDLTGNIQVEDFSKPFDDQIGITGQKVSYPGDQSGTIPGVTNIEDLPQVRTITDGQDNIYDAATGELLGNKYEYQGQFKPDEGTVFDDSSELGYQINQKFNSIKDAGAAGVDKLKDSLTALGGKVKEGFDNVIEIGGKSIDIGKSLASGALSLMTGIPGAGLLLNALPERDERQNALDDLYDVENGTIQSGLMQGYNPVSGNPLDPTFGLQEAYQKRIDTIEKTLAEKYPDGDYSGTELDERLADLKLAKTEEQDVLGITEGVRSGIQAVEDDSGSEMLTDASTGVNPFADRDFDTGVGEFDTAPVTGVTQPETLNKIAADNNINITGGLPTYETLPEGPSTTGTAIDAFNEVNRQQHFDNTEKLKDAVKEGKISTETYNKLSAFDATKTMGLDPITGTLSSIGYQAVQTAAGDQNFNDFLGDTARNIQGVSGNITPEEQVQYQEIISGEDIYRDPILGMVEPPAPMTLADDKINRMTDDVDLDIFDTQSTPVDDYDFSDFDEGDTSVAADVSTGSDPINSFFDTVDNSAQEAAAAASQSSSSYEDQSYSAPSQPAYQGGTTQRPGSGGGDSGGSSGGGGKIVCTMMNESYGFGSFRNKIWMKFHKNLSPEYQKGYHKIFLPLIKIAKTNKVVKKVLEHIAVHSTIDMRQATRGKTHLLGRVYRKIILPLCYWVGKNVK